MNSANDEARRWVESLLEESSRDELIYRTYVKMKIEAGLKDAEQGRVVDHEDVKRMFAKK